MQLCARTLSRSHARTHEHTNQGRWHRVACPARGAGGDLPDMSGNFRSMIYMGITSTDQISIKSSKGAQKMLNSPPLMSPLLKTLDLRQTRARSRLPLLLLLLLLLPSALCSRSAYSDGREHAPAHGSPFHKYQSRAVHLSIRRGSLKENDPSAAWRSATAQVWDPRTRGRRGRGVPYS